MPYAVRWTLPTLTICFGFLGWTLLGGCRTPRRSVPAEGLPTKVTLSLVGLDPSDSGKKDWIYELSGCTGALNGTLGDEDKVVFNGASLKRGLTDCELRIRIVNPDSSFTFSGSENGVLYLAKGVAISQDSDGALVALAELQRLYSVTISKDTRFSLKIPIVFPADEPSSLISGLLDNCEPNFPANSVYTKASARSGTLELIGSVPTQVAVTCKTLRVDVNGVAFKYASVTTDTFAFTAKPGGSAELPSATLIAVTRGPVGTGTSKGVTIKINPATKPCDPTKQIYDTVSRTCKPKP